MITMQYFELTWHFGTLHLYRKPFLFSMYNCPSGRWLRVLFCLPLGCCCGRSWHACTNNCDRPIPDQRGIPTTQNRTCGRRGALDANAAVCCVYGRPH